MKKNILSFCAFSLVFGTFGQVNINDARTNYSVGQTVTIKGVSANGPNQLGTIRYIQDATGGLPAYGSNLNSVQLGDSVTVTGVLYDYNGLLEISPTNSFTNHGNVGAPQPLQINIPNATEPMEGRLVRIQNVTFSGGGNFAANTNYNVSDGSNTLQVRITSGSNLVGTAIPTGAVTVTGLLGQFNANYQLLPRFTTDIQTYTPPAREINIKLGGNDVLTNGNYFIGNAATTLITIENSGSGVLTVNNATFSGPNSSEFSTNIGTNVTIGANSSQNFNLNFSPTGNGTRIATMVVSNDDADEANYTIHLEAVGLDNLASEPPANPTNFTLNNVEAFGLTGTYAAVIPTTGYMVLWSNGSPVTAVPQDGVSYKRGDIIGNARVAYIGTSTSFVPRGVVANQNYHFAVFAFGGQNGFENYRTISPGIASTTTPGLNPGNYYQGIDQNDPSFSSDLSALINPHLMISYFNYKTTMMSQFETRDTTNGQSYVICAYTGERKVFQDPFDWTPTNFSREHTYAHSWMPSYPADQPARPEYSDMHNLYPVNNTQANSIRSNLPLDEITGNVVYTYLEGRAGYGAGGQLVYEPRDANKGNAARAIMYMAVCYNGIDGQNWGIPTNQRDTILRVWHFQDLPDNYEIARQEFIFDLQGNRNPFVDSVDYACSINFYNMNYQTCNTAQLEELLQSNLVIFPVPSSKITYLQVNGAAIQKIKIMDVTGRVISEEVIPNEWVYTLDNNTLSNGQYWAEITTQFGMVTGKFEIQK